MMIAPGFYMYDVSDEREQADDMEQSVDEREAEEKRRPPPDLERYDVRRLVHRPTLKRGM